MATSFESSKAMPGLLSSPIDFGSGRVVATPNPHVIEAAQAACQDERLLGYLPICGLLELREAIAVKAAVDNSHVVDPSQILVTSGAKHGLFSCLAYLLSPGDEVLLPAPVWPALVSMVQFLGAKPVLVYGDGNYRVGVEHLLRAMTSRTKVLAFSSPANPTGLVYTSAEIAAIGRLAADRGLWVVSDEIYEHLVFDGARFASMPVAAPEAVDRCFVINGLSKGYAMPGWRLGWVIGPKSAVEAVAKLQSYTFSFVSGVSQMAALAALKHGAEIVAAVRALLMGRRSALLDGLRSLAGVECMAPEGGLYCLVRIADLLGRRLGRDVMANSARELASSLESVVSVLTLPGDEFRASGHLRFSFAIPEQEIREGISRIRTITNSRHSNR